jgi:hypothetical protein
VDPYQQYQNPNPNSPYEFILSPAKPPKRHISLGDNNLALRIAIIVGGAILLLILILIIFSALQPKNTDKSSLISIAETEDELVHIATQGENDGTQQVTKNLAITTEYSITSQQQGIVKLLANNGTKISTKDLKIKQSAATDQELASAVTTSTFDSVFIQVLQSQLNSYSASLKQLYITTKNKEVKNLTANDFRQVQLLINQVPYVQNQVKAGSE